MIYEGKNEGKNLINLDKILAKIKKIIGIERFDDTKIWIEIDDKLPGDVTLKNVVILITCVIKDEAKVHPKLYSED